MTFLNFKTKKRGISLIEFVLYIGLFALFFSSLFVILDIFYKNRIKNNVALEVEQQSFYASYFISQKIRNAQNINHPSTGNSADNLSLEALDLVKDPLIFSLNDGKIFFSEGASLNENLNSDKVLISNLSFTNTSITDKHQGISFSFTSSYNSNSNQKEYQYSQDFFGSANLNIKP